MEMETERKMSHPLLGNNYRYNEDAGRFINEKHERIAAIIRDYDPELELAWIPPEHRDATDTQPFCIIHNQPDGKRQPISFWREDQIDERILEHIFENDFKKHNPQDIFDRMEAQKLAQQLLREKQIEEEAAERWEFGKSLLKSPLHSYKHNGKTFRG